MITAILKHQKEDTRSVFRSILGLICLLPLIIAGCKLFSPSATEAPIVVLTFDDQHLSVYDVAFPIMQQYGYRGTNFVNSGALAKQERMDWHHIVELEKDYGWETGGHTLLHEQLNQLDLNEAEENICQDFQNLIEHGLKPESFALPRGQCPSQVYPIILNKYKNIRGSSDIAMYVPIDRKSLGYLAFQTGWSAEPVKRRILRGIANNEALIIIGFHHFDAEEYQDSCSSSVFEDILGFLHTMNIQVLPLKEAIDKAIATSL